MKKPCSPGSDFKNEFMKKFYLSLLILIFTFSCGVNKYGIKRKNAIPEEDVRVVLDPKIIISGFKGEDNRDSGYGVFGVEIKNSKKKDNEIKMRPVKEINNEKTSYEFFIPPGEQEINVRARFTKGSYSYISEEVTISINNKSGDTVFICTSIKEVGNRNTSGGMIETVIEPQNLTLTNEDKKAAFKSTDKNKKPLEKKIDAKFFKKKCNALIYGISD
jgi:hypothetical protein